MAARRSVLAGGKVITPVRTLDPGYITWENGNIAEVGFLPGYRQQPGDSVTRVDGKYVAPGFIDPHLHGGGGADVMESSTAALYTIARAHARGGTTSLIPTTLSAPFADICRAVRCIDQVARQGNPGARILGVHIEGPYFSMAQKGAQNPEHLSNPDPNEYLPLLDECDRIIRFSAAPELPGGLQLGRELRSRGIIASVAHTDATYQEVVAAIEAGYTHATHMYSGMSSFKRVKAYRVTGAIESVLLLDELTTEIIADGHHLPPSLMKLIIKAKGIDRVCLTTDAMKAAGQGAGEVTLGGLDVIIEDEIPDVFEVQTVKGNYVAKLADRSAFASSVATMDQLVRNMVNLVGLSVQDAVKMATMNTARFHGITDRGTLAPGMKADIVVFDDSINIEYTIVEGRIEYARNV